MSSPHWGLRLRTSIVLTDDFSVVHLSDRVQIHRLCPPILWRVPVDRRALGGGCIRSCWAHNFQTLQLTGLLGSVVGFSAKRIESFASFLLPSFHSTKGEEWSFFIRQNNNKMATPLIGTAIITGGNGALGSEVAITIAKTQPLIHLLLVAREIDENESVHRVAERVRQIGPRSLEIAKLDLADLDEVATFGKFTVRRVKQKTIPPVVLLINSAATLSYRRNDVTRDGFDPVYQVTCLSPFLLTVSLLEAFKVNGTLVMNIGCSAISEGRLDYFDVNRVTGESAGRGTLTAKEGNVRFGSSKLLMSAAMYGLRRSLRCVSIRPTTLPTVW